MSGTPPQEVLPSSHKEDADSSQAEKVIIYENDGKRDLARIKTQIKSDRIIHVDFDGWRMRTKINLVTFCSWIALSS